MTYEESRRITGPWVATMLLKSAEYEARLASEADTTAVVPQPDGEPSGTTTTPRTHTANGGGA